MTPEDAFRHPWIKAGIKELKQKMEQQPSQENQSKLEGSTTDQAPNTASTRGGGTAG